jgi:hypothetical protein
MNRSGQYIQQSTGYKAFIPSPLPPQLQFNESLHQLLSDADIALGRLDTMGYLLPNLDHIIAMYVRKEALLSSQIEGTQASLEDVFEFEEHEKIVTNAMCEFRFSLYGLCFSRAFYLVASRRKRRKFAHRVNYSDTLQH